MTSPSVNNAFADPKHKVAKEEELTVHVSNLSNDTLNDAEERFWSEYCSAPMQHQATSSKVNSKDRLLQILKHLNKKI